MGSCLSTKKDSSSVADATVPVNTPSPAPVPAKVDRKKCDGAQTQKAVQKQENIEKVKEEEGLVKKEVFVIKHRKSHDKRAMPLQNEEIAVTESAGSEKEKEESGNSIGNGVVRTSSCTKEEVDAILIQCGRLSRSNSSAKTALSSRKYSGSKRSYDFDKNEGGGFERDGGDDNSGDIVKKKGSDEEEQISSQRQDRQRHRQSGRQSPVSRRRTPSRERDMQQNSQLRTGSRERGTGGTGGRRVSRSPGRRSENNNSAANANASGNSASATNRPAKMVSVPATVAVESATATGANSNGVNRIYVKRNAGEANGGVVGSRMAASPRSKSPARVNAKEQQQPSLSRSSSRKAEHSPYRRNPESDPNSTRKTEHSPFRRNPLSEIDPNSSQCPPSAACNGKGLSVNNNRVRNKSRDFEDDSSIKVLYQAQIQKTNAEIVAQGTNHRASSRGTTLKDKVAGANIIDREHQQIPDEVKSQLPMADSTVVIESQNPQTVTRSRSSRLSRDLDLNPETLLNPTPSYTALLLEDIQNFHQKTAHSVSLPACVTKACSILEAVADLNSTTSYNLSGAFSADREAPLAEESNNKNAYKFCAGVNLVGKKMTEAKDPFVESEVFADDDQMQSSFHKYVTVRRGGETLGGVDMDGQESSGSNSFVGSSSRQNWNLSSSSWEPNSADSTDRWTSRSNTKEEDPSPIDFQRRALTEAAGCDAAKHIKGFGGKMRDTNCQQNGNWRGRVAANSS